METKKRRRSMRTAKIHITRNGKHTVRAVFVIGVALLALGLTGCTMTRAACDTAKEECIVEAKVSWPEWFSQWFKPKPAAPVVVAAPAAVAPVVRKTVEK